MGAGCALLMAAAKDADTPSVLVQTVRVRQGSAPRIVQAFGTVQVDSSARDTVVSPLSAIVGAIYVRSGEQVAAGTALLLLTPSPQMGASYSQAVSALRVATDTLQRTRQLLDQHLATRQQLADAEKSDADARAALTALRAQGAAGPTKLRAPARAIVTSIATSVSALVSEGTALLELARPNGLVLTVGVVPAQAAAVSPGDGARLTPVGESRTYAATVLSRSSIIDGASGLVWVRLSVPPGKFLPGQTVQAAITVGMVHGYELPHAAILIDDDGNPYVVQIQHGLAALVHVSVLGRQGDTDTVSGPLDASAPLVLAGNHQLEDGMRVRMSDMPPSASGSATH